MDKLTNQLLHAVYFTLAFEVKKNYLASSFFIVNLYVISIRYISNRYRALIQSYCRSNAHRKAFRKETIQARHIRKHYAD